MYVAIHTRPARGVHARCHVTLKFIEEHKICRSVGNLAEFLVEW